MELMTPTDETNAERFDAIDVRFEEVDQRFDAIDARFEEVDRRFDAIDERFESVNRRFDETDHKIDATREEVVIVKTDIQGIKQEFGEMRKSLDALHFMIHRGSQGVIVALIGVVVAILVKG